MAIQVKISVDSVVKTIEPSDYEDAWHEKCDEEDEHEGSDDYPPIPDAFALECFTEDLESGAQDLSELFENASVSVEVV